MPGRDHWPAVFPAVFAGAGVVGGQLIGKSDRLGAHPISRSFGPPDLAATIYHALGVDPATELRDRFGGRCGFARGRRSSRSTRRRRCEPRRSRETRRSNASTTRQCRRRSVGRAAFRTHRGNRPTSRDGSLRETTPAPRFACRGEFCHDSEETEAVWRNDSHAETA